MPPFDEEQQKEIKELVRGTLGLEEDQTLGDVLKGQVNDALNGYDKRQKRERKEADEKLDERLQGLTEAVEKGAKGPKGDDPDLDDPDAEIDVKKLPPALRAFMDRQGKQMEKLTKQVETERMAREEAQAKADDAEEKRAAQALRDAIRTTSLDKDAVGVEFDLTMSEVMIEHLFPKVRKSETGDGYEMQVGVEDVTNEPIYKPLAEGLKSFGGTTVGKRFQVPVKGQGPAKPQGEKGKTGDLIPAAEVVSGNMTPAQIREASNKGSIELEGAQ